MSLDSADTVARTQQRNNCFLCIKTGLQQVNDKSDTKIHNVL